MQAKENVLFDLDIQIQNITLAGWSKGRVAFSHGTNGNVTSAHTP